MTLAGVLKDALQRNIIHTLPLIKLCLFVGDAGWGPEGRPPEERRVQGLLTGTETSLNYRDKLFC